MKKPTKQPKCAICQEGKENWICTRCTAALSRVKPAGSTIRQLRWAATHSRELARRDYEQQLEQAKNRFGMRLHMLATAARQYLRTKTDLARQRLAVAVVDATYNELKYSEYSKVLLEDVPTLIDNAKHALDIRQYIDDPTKMAPTVREDLPVWENYFLKKVAQVTQRISSVVQAHEDWALTKKIYQSLMKADAPEQGYMNPVEAMRAEHKKEELNALPKPFIDGVAAATKEAFFGDKAKLIEECEPAKTTSFISKHGTSPEGDI